MRCIIPNKIKFVEKLNTTLKPFISNIISIKYKVFKHKDGYYQEYLVINYVGGGKTVRNCNGNGFSSIFEEVSKYLDSGYYLEVQDLEDLENNPNWVEMTLEELEEDYKNK
jgi:hypothetical protein